MPSDGFVLAGLGAAAPTSLDTQSIRSESTVFRAVEATNGSTPEGDQRDPEVWDCPGVTLPSGKVVHHRACRPRKDDPTKCYAPSVRGATSRSWRGWVQGTVAELEKLKARALADRFAQCAQTAYYAHCPACKTPEGDPSLGRIVVRATCEGRVCPWCQRRSAARRSKELNASMTRTARMARQLFPRFLERTQKDHQKALERIDHWTAKAQRARTESSRERAAYYQDRAEKDRARLRRWLRQMGDFQRGAGWEWRLLTLTRWYDPSDPASYTVPAIRAVIADLRAQWDAVWAQLSLGGLAGAYTVLECSDRGHIHMHVLYWGPWASNRKRQDGGESWLDRIQAEAVELAGRAHIRETDDEVSKEAAKYATKAPTPLDPAWFAGDPRPVLDPRVAAAWCVATRREQLRRIYGMLRAAWVSLPTVDSLAWRSCCDCGCDLGSPALWTSERTAAVASANRARWRDLLAIRSGE